MLERIKIQRFKSLKGEELHFGRVNLFIGGNGAGKSNILEAIGLIAAALNRGVQDSELSRKGVRLTPPAMMKSAFKNSDLPPTLRLEAEFTGEVEYALELSASDRHTALETFSEKGKVEGHQVFGRSRNGPTVMGKRIARTLDLHRSIWDQTRSAFDFPRPMQDEFDALSRYAIYAPQTEFLRETQTGIVESPPVGLHGEGLGAAVDSLLVQYHEGSVQAREAMNLVWLPGWTSSVGVEALNARQRSTKVVPNAGRSLFFTDKFMNMRRNKLSAYDSSEGTLYLLFIAVLLGHSEAPPIFALDSFDNALNPALTKSLIKAVVDGAKRKVESGLAIGPSQVFLTSHNPTSLDAFDLFDDDQRVFVVQRNEKGHTVATRLQPASGMSREDWARAFEGRKLSQMWIDGDIRGALGVQAPAL
ncbi:conserved hypothetical protein [Magnetospirillum sp. LM-5]|uniref:AAA family ATPase n=1 Tax=Magnetospirillum sp. LM-5 TaxID=2681466 RepID=UPI00137F7BEE|nr:ATP-binding protein [Magnetospirillum sp. LM-5]CAA7623288.1 conserved hypothetical protein [Magnetospirillum sp. LM-5]